MAQPRTLSLLTRCDPAPRTAAAALALWSERARQRRALRALDARLRRDVGLSPAEVEAEARKPFWRA